ncbi:hypothetical protein DZD52_01320 [Xanthomonas nasturtii]|uniref:Uncharacterized protein n=1 Tax=Xanthomonas nasturtii TaxID=1843581 RepID=A0A3E1KSE4_9XANT|nr:hypothetical protein DZD52_01320 [Xanthomonas nasturtii]
MVGAFIEERISAADRLLMVSLKSEDTPSPVSDRLSKPVHTDHLDWSLPAHYRGTLSGMDAAPEPPGTDSRSVLR